MGRREKAKPRKLVKKEMNISEAQPFIWQRLNKIKSNNKIAGDNPNILDTSDSRTFGPLKINQIIGKLVSC